MLTIREILTFVQTAESFVFRNPTMLFFRACKNYQRVTYDLSLSLSLSKIRDFTAAKRSKRSRKLNRQPVQGNNRARVRRWSRIEIKIAGGKAGEERKNKKKKEKRRHFAAAGWCGGIRLEVK